MNTEETTIGPGDMYPEILDEWAEQLRETAFRILEEGLVQEGIPDDLFDSYFSDYAHETVYLLAHGSWIEHPFDGNTYGGEEDPIFATMHPYVPIIHDPVTLTKPVVDDHWYTFSDKENNEPVFCLSDANETASLYVFTDYNAEIRIVGPVRIIVFTRKEP